ncbi:hypothetical protein niasHS_010033 [Heterodera schachtii]|uniref:ANK_REP_REGION domain-containing protein n=2 Tax=Heterodera TaxID=34509 RepID=A0ABD2IYH2_HETSC
MPHNKKTPRVISSKPLSDDADRSAEGSSNTQLVQTYANENSEGGADSKKKKKKNNKKKKNAPLSVHNEEVAKKESKKGAEDEREDDCFGEKNKRRTSLTDSPLTELSPSSTTSNGDSADDTEVAKSSSKLGSSCGTVSNSSSSNFYVVNAPPSSSYSSVGERQQQQNMHFLSEITEEENINEVEREYAFEIVINQKKQLKYNKWTEQLCQSIFGGDFRTFYRRFKMVMICLRKRKSAHYERLTDAQLASHVAEMIIDKFHNKENQTTILMVLLSNSEREVKCADRDHGYCRIAHMLLKLLTRSQLDKLLEVTAAKSGKNALHLATATGQPCQLQVLLALTEIDANHFDFSMRAALHYAIERNNLDMVRLLMWYGADISLCHSRNAHFDPLRLSLCVNPNSSVQHWLSSRVDALSNKIRFFVRQLCARCFSIRSALSPVHFIRFGGRCWPFQQNNAQITRDCQLNLRANGCSSLAQLLKQNANSRILLFIVPVSFRTSDQFSAASDPKIVHVEFPDSTFIISTSIMYNSQPPAKALNNTVFSQRHNSHFYAFDLSSSTSCVEGLHKLVMSIKSTSGFTSNSRAVLLAVQAYLCFQQSTDTANAIDEYEIKDNNNKCRSDAGKAKLD